MVSRAYNTMSAASTRFNARTNDCGVILRTNLSTPVKSEDLSLLLSLSLSLSEEETVFPNNAAIDNTLPDDEMELPIELEEPGLISAPKLCHMEDNETP